MSSNTLPSDQDFPEKKHRQDHMISSEPNFQLLVEHLNDIVLSLNQSGKITYVNPLVEKILGYAPAEVIGQHFSRFIIPEDLALVTERFNESLQGTSNPARFRALSKQGHEVYLRSSSFPLRSGEQIIGVIGVLTDITKQTISENKAHQNALRIELLNEIARKIGQSLDMHAVIDTAVRTTHSLLGYQHVSILLFDPERQVLVLRSKAGEFAQIFSERHILNPEQGMVGWVYRNGRSLLANDVSTEPSYVNFYPEKLQTRSELSVPIRLENETLGVLDIQSSRLNAFSETDVVFTETLAEQIAIALKNARLMQSMQQELAERRKIAQALHESERKLSILLSNLPGMVYRCQNDQYWTMEFISQGSLELTGYQPAELVFNRKIEFVELIHPDDRQKVWDDVQEALQTRRIFSLVYRIQCADGKEKWVMDRGQGVYSEQGELQAIEGVALDISDRKLIEEQLQTSLAEKEILLNEVHHRVKNNLEVILSLAEMQTRRLEDEQARASIRVLQERIRTIALVHENLYHSQSLAAISVQNYLNKLIDNLCMAFGPPGIKVSLESEDVPLDVDYAIPCGLIVTELVTNCMKYSFPADFLSHKQLAEDYQAEILVSLREESPSAERSSLVLEVRDNGQGFPDDFDLDQVRTLGLRLVKSLVGQLHGSLEYSNQHGASFRIWFPSYR